MEGLFWQERLRIVGLLYAGSINWYYYRTVPTSRYVCIFPKEATAGDA